MDTAAVECGRHGLQQETFVCGHVVRSLRDKRPIGFFYAPDPTNPRPDAWCRDCNDRLNAGGGKWTTELERSADISLICGACYDEVQALNGA